MRLQVLNLSQAIYQTGSVFEAGDSLVYSYNDWAGLGLHGDFLNGWQEGAVEDMLDYCIHHQVEAYSTVCCTLLGTTL